MGIDSFRRLQSPLQGFSLQETHKDLPTCHAVVCRDVSVVMRGRGSVTTRELSTPEKHAHILFVKGLPNGCPKNIEVHGI